MKIREFTPEDAAAYFDHCVRHNLESNEKDGERFSPREHTEDFDKPSKVDEYVQASTRGPSDPNWARIWVLENESGLIVGACRLSGPRIPTELHRCSLGIGIEKEARGLGHGWAMMEHAVSWAREQESLFWIDLYVFSHNEAARKMYDAFGFQTFGMVMDKFRVHGQSIDDIHMCLLLKEE